MSSVWVVLHVHRHGEDLWAFDNEADAEAKAGAIEAGGSYYETGSVEVRQLELGEDPRGYLGGER